MKDKNMWKPDTQHSEVCVSVGHLGISEISGTFNDFDATLSSSKEDFSDLEVEATIKVASVDTRIEARNAHLRTPDFFNVERYPLMTFKSKSLRSTGNGTYKMTGDLTAMDNTKNIEMDLVYRGTVESMQTQKTTAGFKLSGILKRSDFGIGANIPTALLSDEVQITIHMEFQKQ